VKELDGAGEADREGVDESIGFVRGREERRGSEDSGAGKSRVKEVRDLVRRESKDEEHCSSGQALSGEERDII
jgi:hypothetical protein